MHFHPDTVQSRIDTPLGPVRLAASPAGLCGLWFEGQQHQPAQLDGAAAWPMSAAHPLLVAASDQLGAWLVGERHRFDLPVDLSGGTPFQQAVWRALLDIAWGQTRSYSQVAQLAGAPAAVRAVGGGRGAQPDFAGGALPPRAGRKRGIDRLCRWAGAQARALGARRRLADPPL